MLEKKVSLLNKTPAKVSHMEAVREKLVVEVLDGYL